jgi:23S rRNA pseudouridine1911/1915/1917 synthase
MREGARHGKAAGVLRWTRVPAPPRTLTADRGDAGRRLDLVVRRHLTDLSAATRTRVQAWIEGGRVTVNGAVVRRVATRAALGDVVAVLLPSDLPVPRDMLPEQTPVIVLYEDDHLLVVDKPAGLVVHPTYTHVRGTLMNALLGVAKRWPAPQRPSLVGRLDKLTSGIVVVAKSPAMHAALQRTMAAAESEKDYLAMVHGRVKMARGRIDMPLGRDPSDRRKVVVSEDGAASITLFERMGRTPAARGGLSLLHCRLITGRTHQIRVHLAAKGWPIVGDPVYGEPSSSRGSSHGTSRGTAHGAGEALARALEAFPRQALHAWRVGFIHPATREPLSVEAPVPVDLHDLIDVSGLAPLFEAALSRSTLSGSTLSTSTTRLSVVPHRAASR